MYSISCIVFFERFVYIIVSFMEYNKMPMVSLQLSDEILQKFDEIRQESGYLSRSEALRDAILKFISEHKQQSSSEIKRSIISVVYTPDANKLEMFASIEHRFETGLGRWRRRWAAHLRLDSVRIAR